MPEVPPPAGSPVTVTSTGAEPGPATAVRATEDAGAGVLVKQQHTDLITPMGRTSISDAVVRKIAGIAARQIDGVHDLGSGAGRAFSGLRQRVAGSPSRNAGRGVAVEVGERQTAVDIDLVVEYGVSIVELSHAVRRNVIERVEQMTGLEVTEVNIAIDDVHVEGYGDDENVPSSRVR